MSNLKYATLEIPDGLTFTAIANEMAKDGECYTPARIRLIVLKSLEKIIRKVGATYGRPVSRENAELIAKEVDFQNIIAPLIQSAYEA